MIEVNKKYAELQYKYIVLQHKHSDLLNLIIDIIPHIANNYSSPDRERILKPLKEKIEESIKNK